MTEKNYRDKYIKYKKKYTALQTRINLNDDTVESEIINNPSSIFIDANFPDHKNVDKTQIQITNISLFSTSGKVASEILANIIKHHTHTSDITITDMTANVGSETIRFALNFKQVNSIEIDPLTCNALKHNINVYSLKNVNVFCGDSSEIVGTLKQDVIYMDPPWGGRDYKSKEFMNLELGGIDIAEIVLKNIKNAKYFVIRIPKNYDLNNFYKKLGPMKTSIYAITKSSRIVNNDPSNIKFYVVVIDLLISKPITSLKQ